MHTWAEAVLSCQVRLSCVELRCAQGSAPQYHLCDAEVARFHAVHSQCLWSKYRTACAACCDVDVICNHFDGGGGQRRAHVHPVVHWVHICSIISSDPRTEISYSCSSYSINPIVPMKPFIIVEISDCHNALSVAGASKVPVYGELVLR